MAVYCQNNYKQSLAVLATQNKLAADYNTEIYYHLNVVATCL